MKTKNILNLTIAAVLGLGVTSCSDFMDINSNPNYPSDVEAKSLVNGAEASLISVLGYQGYITGNMWLQYCTQGNTTNQYNTLAAYNMNSSSSIPPVINMWTYNYANGLKDLDIAIEKSSTAEQWNYWVAAKVLQAYTYMEITDTYGDIPCSESLTSENPKFDDSKTVVYPAIIKMLDEAIAKKADAETANMTNNMSSSETLIGNPDGWVSFAKTLKLKALMKDPIANKVAIKTLLDGNDFYLDDVKWTSFENSTNKGNPFYEMNIRQLNTTENVRASHTFLEFLQAKKDPRIIYLYNHTTASRSLTGVKYWDTPDYAKLKDDEKPQHLKGYLDLRKVMHGVETENAETITPLSADPDNFEEAKDSLIAYMDLAYEGIAQGASKYYPNSTNGPVNSTSRFKQSYSDPVYLLNAAEANLLLAEAYVLNDDLSSAETYYNTAIAESFSRYGLSTYTLSFQNGAYKFDASSKETAMKSIGMMYWVSYAGANTYDGWITRNRLGLPAIQKNIMVRKDPIPQIRIKSNKLVWTGADPSLTDGYILGNFVDPTSSVAQEGQYPMRLPYPLNTIDYNTNAKQYVDANGNDPFKSQWWSENQWWN